MMFCRAGAQGLYPVSLDEKIGHSSLIVEGKVISQEGFWNDSHSMIFTRNRVAVYKIFKGNFQADSVDIITTGGSVGNKFMSASHLLQLNKSDVGVFFCHEAAKVSKNIIKGFEVYSSAQGFFKYDMKLQGADAPFVKYQDISRQLYKALNTKTGRQFKIVNSAFRVMGENTAQVNILNQLLAPVISSFSPATVTAGTLLDPANNVLTINGSGFDNAPSGAAAVFFDNPDDGSGGSYSGVSFDSPLILSWADNQIRVRVPSKAGSGLIYVRNSAGALAGSASNLVVTFSVLDAVFTIAPNTDIYKEIRPANLNGLGGYTILYSNNTNNNGVDIFSSVAKSTFQRALTTWKECSGFNVIEGGADTQQLVNAFDSTNMVMFDNNFPGNIHLPAGVLAVCYISGSICTDDIYGNQAFKPGFDIVIRNSGVSTGPDVSFSYGPCSPFSSSINDVDLETVIFHELGHAVNLGHINDGPQGTGPTANPQKVMNYALNAGLRRISEDYSAMLGAAYMINPKGVALGPCTYGEMIPLATISEPNDNCPASFPVTPTSPNTSVTFDLVHATSNKFVDPGYLQLTTDGSFTAITNTAYYAFKTNSAGGNLSLSISGYTTVPASIASCPTGPRGIPVTGVQLAVYQVASCPAGQSFPTPILSTSFQSDGIIPVNGLAANTNYLLLFDGIENTKAIFTVTFAGAALPLRITEFSGKALDTENMIWWKAEAPDNNTELSLERSADGISFTTLSSAVQLQDVYHDNNALAGDNYYRLAIKGKDGAMQYSKTIILAGKQALRIFAFPNPAHESLSLTISGPSAVNYSAVLYNTTGQAVRRKTIFVREKYHIEKINAAGLAAGVYHLALSDQWGHVVKSLTVVLK